MLKIEWWTVESASSVSKPSSIELICLGEVNKGWQKNSIGDYGETNEVGVLETWGMMLVSEFGQ